MTLQSRLVSLRQFGGLILLAGGAAALAQPAVPGALEIRFQSPARGEIVTRYADGVLTTEGKSDSSSGKWWTGNYTVKIADLDLENVNYGTFTTEPGAIATLSCKGSGDCVSRKGTWVQIKCDADLCNKNVDPSGTDSSVDVWCESVEKCRTFVTALKEALKKAPAP